LKSALRKLNQACEKAIYNKNIDEGNRRRVSEIVLATVCHENKEKKLIKC
jgi:hypothetical protein